ncbi:hypothetical protein [Bacteroides eggerthii]|uniref:hypothetical protein n=1 Tax=Bacteroides eggerthii TaxID=28111 RepID=UPI0002EC341A|nr:hypothetical protein [Bacteroides eggerthii]
MKRAAPYFYSENWVTDAVVFDNLSHSVSWFLQMRFWSIKTACKYENYGGFRDKMSRWYLQIIVRLRNG